MVPLIASSPKWSAVLPELLIFLYTSDKTPLVTWYPSLKTYDTCLEFIS